MSTLTHLAVASIFFALSSAAFSQALAQLYPAKPPEGSSFVRIINPMRDPVKVSLAGIEEKQSFMAPANIATSYKNINPAHPLRVVVNGKTILLENKVSPNAFVSLVVTRADGEYTVIVVNDATQGQNALKADLRIYNFVPGCTASVLVDKKVKVFDNLAEGASQRRAINPVVVDLVAMCDKAESPIFTLPQLQPGSRYSLFLTGNIAKPVIIGNTDSVE
jgi:alginate O-acetyltransferase complex protein AlgF